MQFALTTSLSVGVILFLTPPTGSQCTLPTEQDVKSVANAIFTVLNSEGDPPTVKDLFQVHFTCLVTVAQDMYMYASVVTNFTTGSDPVSTQFQLVCMNDMWSKSTTSFFETPPAMPFAIETKFGCYMCEEYPPDSFPPNYDPDSNCVSCDPVCNNAGGGFCNGSTAADCCPFFNNENGACVDDCTTIDPDFGPNENFACVCSISCSPGFEPNTIDCSCVLSDGCEAAGQPCANGGTCVSDLLAPAGGPYYKCMCANGFSGQNCTDNLLLYTTSTTSKPLPSATVTEPPTSDGGFPPWAIAVIAIIVGIIFLVVVILIVALIIYLIKK